MINNVRIQCYKRSARWSFISKLTVSVSVISIVATMSTSKLYAQDDSKDAIEEIVVTGSRLVRSDLSAPSPVSVLSAANIRSSGNVTIEETLNELPQLAADNTSSANAAGGSGVLTADLRGLGAERTLVLVNGRRFIPANESGFVDLASIPDALVQSVEIITGGASAVYGSDAVAGAINFKLKDNFEGLEANYSYGQTFKGDGLTHKIDITVGGNFADDRGNAVINGSFTSRGGVFFEDREFSRLSLFVNNGKLAPGGSSNVPGTRISLKGADLANLVGVNLNTCEGGSRARGVRFDSSGAPVAFCDPQDRFNFAKGNYLLRPLKRYQINGLGHYDVTDNITAYAELIFVDSRNEYQQAPNAGELSTNGAPRGELHLPDYANNTTLSQPFRDFLSRNAWKFDPDGDGVAVITSTGRRFIETGARTFKYERSSFAITGGLRGDFEISDKNWQWDSFYQFQRTKSDSDISGEISSVRMSLGLDVIPDPKNPGKMICRNQFDGCVPVNPFGIDSISPKAAAFISPNHGSTTVLERQVFGGYVSGELLELPAGPVAAAFGFEHRRENFDFRPDSSEQGGEFGDPTPPRNGAFNLTEFYAEARVPLITDSPMAEYLGLELAIRTSNYSNFGSVTTWKVGGEWMPIDWIRVRGAYNVAIRAPNLSELFSTVSIGFTAGDDLCDKDFKPSAAQKALCVAQGVSSGDIDDFEHNNVGFGVQTGGNPNLTPENSDTWTIGAVISPSEIEGLNITVDYYSIKIDNAIAKLNAQYIVNTCFAGGDNSTAECQAIVRTSDGQIDYVRAPISNIATEKATGVDLQIDYGFELPSLFALGSDDAGLKLSFMSSWILKSERTPLPGGTAIDCAGHFGSSCSGFGTPMLPANKQVFNMTYESGPLSVRFQTRRIAGFTHFKPDPKNVIKSTPAEFYLDLSTSYQALENVEIFVGIDNIANAQPPILGYSLAGDANVDPGLYDLLGRRFFGGVRVKF